MPVLDRLRVSLNFYGDDLDPAELTLGLGAPPTTGVAKGGTWHTSRGFQKVARHGMWLKQLDERSPADPDAQVADLFAPLTKDMAIWRDFAGRFQGRIFCGLFLAETNEGLAWQPETLAAISARGLLLDLDIYGAPTGE